MATRREIMVNLKANVTDFKKQIGQGAQSLDDLAKKAGGAEKASQTRLGRMAQSAQLQRDAWNTAGAALTGFGAAAVAGVGLAVSTFADFDQAMSSVQAATMESEANMEALREAAIQAGADTQYSATEAAAGIEELAKAGVSTADILNGGLNGALDLAAAGGIGVAEAAETAASAMTQFKLEGSDVTHIADLLAAGAGKAQGGVSDMSAALNQAGLVASQMGLSIEETVGSLTAFASAGLVGSDAGTSFRAMLLRVANPTKESAELMEQLGLNFYDAQGQFIGMEGVAGQLQDRLSGLTQEQRNAAMAQIFGQDAIRASSILYEEGAEGVREWTAAVDEQGYASEVAAARMDNLKGDLEALSGSFETLMIRLGEGANSPLRSVVQSLDSLVDSIGKLPTPVLNTVTALSGIAGVASLAAGGFLLVFPRVMDTYNAFQRLKEISPPVADGMTKVGGAFRKIAGTAGQLTVAAGAALAVGKAVKEIIDAGRGIDRTAAGLEEVTNAIEGATGAGGYYTAAFGEMADAGRINVGMFEDLGEAAEKVANQNWADKFFGGLGMDATGIADVTKQFETMGQALAAMPLDDAQAKFRAMWREAGGDAVAGENLLDSMPAYREAIYAAANEAGVAGDAFDVLAWATGEAGTEALEAASANEELAASAEASTATIEGQVEAVGDLIDNLSTLYGNVLSARDAERQLEQSVADLSASLEANGNTFDITTEKGRANQAALDDVASSSWDVIDAMKNNGATAGELQGKMSELRGRFVAAAEGAGYNADEANRLADELGLIPENVNTHVTTTGIDSVIQNVSVVTQMINGIPTTKNVTFTGTIASSLRQAQATANATGKSVASAYATGGPVVGPGTGTSDSIPALLSNGEYVIKADSVKAYGRSFFDAVNAQRFASGGYVGPTVNVTAPAGSGVTFNQNGPVYTTDPAALARANVTRMRDAVSAYGLGGHL